MMNNSLNIYSFITFLLLASYGHAQSVDLCGRQHQDKLEIFLHPKETFEGIVSEVKFTLRWPVDIGTELAVTYDETWGNYFSFHQASQPIVIGDSMYQTILGFGKKTLYDFGQVWDGMNEIPLMSVYGNSGIEITNHFELESLQRNLYIELDGYEQTGEICRIISSIENPIAEKVNIYPNPFSDEWHIEISHHFGADINIQISDITGRKIFVRNVQANMGQKLNLNTASWAVGTYFCTISSPIHTWTYKVQKVP